MSASPICHQCGFVMVERFRYEKINRVASRAIPLGVFDCLRCERSEQPTIPPPPAPPEET